MRLATLIEHVDVLRVQGDLDREVTGVTRDTRRLASGGVFVAIEGAHVDGHELVGRAGDAAAVVVERAVQAPPGVAVVRVGDTRQALAALAAAFHGHPGRDVRVVGITGTNGKTTVATLLHAALRRAGWRAGRIGTTGVCIDDQALDSALTTPEAPDLQTLLAHMRDEGVGVVAMEVSSVGLVQRRVDGIPFHLGVFTNLGRDHLDFHGDLEAYRAAKARLFGLLRPPGGAPRALLCGDDPAAAGLGAPEDRWTYGTAPGNDLHIEHIAETPAGLTVQVATPQGPATLRSALVGRYNALNLAAALGCCLALGVGLAEAAEAVSAVPGVPGRLERIANARGVLAFVDYAHDPVALEVALRAVRTVTPGRLWVVFGCGGDRDRGKRSRMGAVAEREADRVVVTSDNPRSEDPQSIVDAILSGMDDPPAHVALDRRAAIGWAAEHAREGDAILVAGKGHETWQEIAGTRQPFDDRDVLRSWLGEAA